MKLFQLQETSVIKYFCSHVQFFITGLVGILCAKRKTSYVVNVFNIKNKSVIK